ncbi:formylglycine-generating enzyme family protein [Prevotella sp. P5-92]|uniref:formylglycine-generating enzyme family protein n=1 Tax=Prevotella sp. P5-92 TaxID=2024222 RepID=UPI0020B12DB1|nr:formylglycine-generating enzyme family protein [Prevotella sp. P5-92]
MKQIILTFTLLLCATFSFTQELKVKSFTHDEMNLEARLDGGRTDLNGKQCALVKVMVRDDILECKGGNVGDIVSKGVVKMIFVSPSARYLELEFKYNFPLKVTFADYGYATLSEGCTYTITLVDANMTVQQPVAQHQATSLQQQSSTVQQQEQYNSSYPTIEKITANGVSFNMIKVDGGTFTMGATPEMTNPWSYEKPTHKVTLSSYYIGETEVTQELWNAVVGKNPSCHKGDNLPVEYVSWKKCQEFINKLNELTGKHFRFPTEAEWEFAARGGTKSRHTQYSGSDNINEVAWYDGNSGRKTHPVKTKQANELGIYDMTGNVWEWCSDKYGKYSSNDQIDPKGSEHGYRVNRGGGCNNSTRYSRISNRLAFASLSKGYNLGLRLAYSMNN